MYELYVTGCERINDVTHMRNLKVLHACYNCAIDQKGITGLNLIKFICNGNGKFYDVSFMRNLKILNALKTKIDQNGIRGLDLIEFEYDKDKITDVSFMKNLVKGEILTNLRRRERKKDVK